MKHMRLFDERRLQTIITPNMTRAGTQCRNSDLLEYIDVHCTFASGKFNTLHQPSLHKQSARLNTHNARKSPMYNVKMHVVCECRTRDVGEDESVTLTENERTNIPLSSSPPSSTCSARATSSSESSPSSLLSNTSINTATCYMK